MKILDAALSVMKQRQNTLNALKKYELTERGLGIEGWFTIELLTDKQFNDWGTIKIQTPADLKIQEKFVEVKGLSDTDFTWITDWWKSREIKPAIVLFLSVFNTNMKNQIDSARTRGHKIEYKPVNKDWIVGILKGTIES